MPLDPTARTATGGLIVALSAVAFSTAGFFTRLIEADVWTVLFWRGLFGGLLIFAVIAWRARGETAAAFGAIGRRGMVVAGCSSVATICFIAALRQTTVADVTIIYSTAPFIAAAIGWVWGNERAAPATLLASLMAVAGVAVMFAGGSGEGRLVGGLLALAMTGLMALMMVMIRRSRQVSMLPAACLSAFACAALVLPLAAPAAVTAAELGLLALFGTTQFGLGLLLLTIGSRLIPPARASLLGNLELPFAPLWVWLAFGETPSVATGLGGAIVCAAVLVDVWADRMRRRGSGGQAGLESGRRFGHRARHRTDRP